MTSKKLLNALIKIAFQEATAQIDDVWNLGPRPQASASLEFTSKPQGPNLQLEVREESCGGRILGEASDAPYLNPSNREGEYRFVDESNLKRFMRIDGMPTAKRALLYVMRNRNEISEREDVWMTFVGSLDEGKHLWCLTEDYAHHCLDLGPAKPHRFRLQSILAPLKFWDTLTARIPNFNPEKPKFESLFEDTTDEMIEHPCAPFWQFALGVVRTSPHMLKPGYKTLHGYDEIQRFSWARMLVLIFLPEEELMKELFYAGLSPEVAPSGWYREARDRMKHVLMTHASEKPQLRSAIAKGWDRLCAELDQAFFDDFLYSDYVVPQPAQPIRGHSRKYYPASLGAMNASGVRQLLNVDQQQSITPPPRGEKRNRNSMTEADDRDGDFGEDSMGRKKRRSARLEQSQSTSLLGRSEKRSRNSQEDTEQDSPSHKKRRSARLAHMK